MRRYLVLTLAIAALIGWAIQSNAAQTTDLCPGFISQAIETVGNNCGGLARNNACYGYNTVMATFDQLPSPEYFTSPSDLADLFNLRTIGTTPLQTSINEWGISLLSVQANLPDALPGQNVIFMLAGDVEMENEVDPVTLADPDAEQSPMQAFYFRTGIAQTECREAPDTMMVQGPRGVQVDFTANGADIRIGSTIALRTIEITPAQAQQITQQYGLTQTIYRLLELVVLDGEAILDPDTPSEQRVPQGYHALRCLAEPEDLGVNGDTDDTPIIVECPWLDIRRLTDAEIQEFAGYEGMVLNYPITLPDGTTVANVPTIPPPPATTIPPATTAAPTVSATYTPPTATSTTPLNVPPDVMLDPTPPGSTPRDNYYLNGTYNDPDDDTLTMVIDWGDGSTPQEVLLGGGEGGEGSFARLVAGSFNIPHVYPTNGLFDISVTVEDSAGNQITRDAQANVDALMPLDFTLVSGDGQGALPNTAFPDPLVGLLVDFGGAPVVDYFVRVASSNATTDANCDGGICYVMTDAMGHATLNATAGATPGVATVAMDADSGLTITFNLTVSTVGNSPPTVDINTDQLTHQNGDIFTLDYAIDDPEGGTMSVAIYWGDSDTPEPVSGLSSGAHFIDHEFTAVGTLTITVVVTDDGDLTASDVWVLDVLPLYPLTVSNDPQGGWTGEVVGGDVYPGTVRISVSDSQNDPLLGEPLLSAGVASISPTTTLNTPGTGFADVTVTSDCEARTEIKIGAQDPTAPGSIRSTTISVLQHPPYKVSVYGGNGQTTYVTTTFAQPLISFLEDHNGNPVIGATVIYTLQTTAGAAFTGGGGITYSATTDSGGYATSDTIRAGGEEILPVEAAYTFGACTYSALFSLQVQQFDLIARPGLPDTPEATGEVVVLPESTAEATAEVTDEPTAPEATDEVVLPPESTEEAEATEEVVVPVFPTPTHTPTATSTFASPSAPTMTPTP